MSLPSLPPGIYTIQSQETPPRGVSSPASENATLGLTRPAPNDAKQHWQITNDGGIISIDSTRHAFVMGGVLNSPSFVGAPVISSSSAIRIFWVFGLPGFVDAPGTFTRSISFISPAGLELHWGCLQNNENIQLATETCFWTFTPVS